MDKYFINRLILKNALQFPNRDAVTYKGEKFSYGQLDLFYSQVVNVLNANIEVDKPVALLLKPSIEYVCSIIGINTVGGVFMPLDISNPMERLRKMLLQAKPPVVITDNEGLIRLNQILTSLSNDESWSVNLLCVEIKDKIFSIFSVDGKSIVKSGNETLKQDLNANSQSPEDSAYLMFTSGSTGEPKAIEGVHKSLSHFIHWELGEFNLDSNTRVSLLAPLNFDVSLRDIFVPLLSGGVLCIPEKDLKFEIINLIKWIAMERINLIHCVPSTFRLLIEEFGQDTALTKLFSKVRHILLAGEALYRNDIIAWQSIPGLEHIKLVNLYGPSETTLAKLYYNIPKRLDENCDFEIIPLGKPINNTTVLILNKNELCEVGEIGEICIKTPFRTKGYFRNEELTSSRFIQNPIHDEFDDIIYKTGDLGRVLQDGNIIFEGRKDGLIKINGNRVELFEIEKVLNKCNGIDKGIVIAKEHDDYSKSISCFYSSTANISKKNIRHFLSEYLPDYMLPSYYEKVTKFPVNVNGKIDRQKLIETQIHPSTELEGSYLSENERKVERIWKDVLKVNEIDRKSSFFEVGGSSLKVIQIISRIYNEFKVVLKLPDVLKQPTIEGITNSIESKQSIDHFAIPSAPERENYYLSSAQLRIWALQNFGNHRRVYNIYKSLAIDGELNLQKLEESMFLIIERHEILRTAFIVVNGSPRQVIKSTNEINFNIEVRPCDENSFESHLRKLESEIRQHVFDLRSPPLMKIIAIPVGRKFCHLLFVGHHIVLDARSFDILFHEILSFYYKYSDGNNTGLSPLSLQYKDYAEWEKNSNTKSSLGKMKSFWQAKLGEELPIINLPYDFERPLLKTYNGELVRFSIDEKEFTQLKRVSAKSKATKFCILLTLFKILLYKYSGDKDIVVGTPVSNRNHKELENLIGVFVNTIILKTEISKSVTFNEQLLKVNELVQEALEYREYPFEKLMENVSAKRDESRAPLFDVLFSYLQRDYSQKENYEKLNLKITGKEKNISLAKYDLSVTFTELDHTLNASLEYNTDLFKKDTIKQMIIHFKRVINEMLFKPNKKISDFSLLNQKEIFVLSTNGYKSQSYNNHQNIIQAIEKQVLKTPNNIAVIYDNREYTYSDLNKMANRLGYYLLNMVKQGSNVGILLDRSAYMIISILAVLKAGCTYVPLDPEMPQKRQRFILDDAGVDIAILNKKYVDSTTLSKVIVVEDESSWNQGNDENHISNVSCNDPIYILYTSGTTGVPKGVVNRHISILNLSLWLQEEIYEKYKQPVATLLNAELVFDASVQQIFSPLISGASVHIVSNELRKNPKSFLLYLEREKIAVLDATPSFLSLFLSESSIEHSNKSLQYMLLGGEPLSTSVVSFCNQRFPNAKIINVYGVTEAAVDSAYSIVDTLIHPSLISTPVPNTRLYVLDRDKNPIPPNCIGELYVSGDGLAKGYLNNPELTKERFIPSPFIKGETLFNTKDLCKRSADNKFLLLGRSDDQVKLRGYRIQLSEITSVLLSHALIDDAIVTCWVNDKEDKHLTGYYVSNDKIDQGELRDFLEKILPYYMIPTNFIQVTHIPINAQGKKDVSTLPSPELSDESTTNDSLPSNFLERSIVKIWEEILGKDNIGTDDDFFSLGGHSINAIQILSRMNKELNIEVELSSIFLNPTVISLSQHIEKNGEFTYEA